MAKGRVQTEESTKEIKISHTFLNNAAGANLFDMSNWPKTDQESIKKTRLNRS
ncbi:hypothetical protein Fmac_031680 [Flemingia macrophylla]|uniref:Uncharacterized protein n=1 Tax=Flemingia macrophylla TaxID=520843 RepID=A0ABD1L2Q5_9FABA